VLRNFQDERQLRGIRVDVASPEMPRGRFKVEIQGFFFFFFFFGRPGRRWATPFTSSGANQGLHNPRLRFKASVQDLEGKEKLSALTGGCTWENIAKCVPAPVLLAFSVLLSFSRQVPGSCSELPGTRAPKQGCCRTPVILNGWE